MRTSGLLPLWVASIVGRLPLGALSLVLLLRTREMTGSYAAGGLAAGAYGLAAGLGSPFVGRLIDRRGQRLVLIAGAAAQAAVLVVFATLPDGTSPAVATLVAGAVGVTQPPLSACLRALLTTAVGPEQQHRAFTIDSTIFEVVFILGPTLIVGVISPWSLRAAVLACGVLCLAGTLAFTATRLSRLAARGLTAGQGLAGPLVAPGVRVLIVAVALFGCGVSSMELGWAAFADDEGHRTAVGYLFALSGIGSMIGGVIAARLPPPPDPVRRLVAILVAMTVLEAPFPLMPSLPAMGVASLISGLCFAPSLGLLYQLTAAAAPVGMTTEALTWVSSAIAAGGAAGSALAGALASGPGTAVALATVAVFTALQTAWIAVRSRTLSGARTLST